VEPRSSPLSGFKQGKAMQAAFVPSLVLAAWAAVAGPERAAAGPESLTVVLQAGKDTPYEEIVKVIKPLTAAKGTRSQLKGIGRQTPGVTAVLRASGNTPYRAVVEAVEALRSAGVRTIQFGSTP